MKFRGQRFLSVSVNLVHRKEQRLAGSHEQTGKFEIGRSEFATAIHDKDANAS